MCNKILSDKNVLKLQKTDIKIDFTNLKVLSKKTDYFDLYKRDINTYYQKTSLSF